MRFKKTQIGNLMNSETKSMKKRNEYFIKEVELLKDFIYFQREGKKRRET